MKLLKTALLSGFVILMAGYASYAQQPISWYGIFPGTYSQRIVPVGNGPKTSPRGHHETSPTPLPNWTNTYYSMAGFNTKWYGGNTSKPAYQEYFLADNNDPVWGKFNFRFLSPVGYNANDPYLYPLIVMLHGAGERGNCWGGTCYVKYTNGVPAYDIKYWNNDHNLLHGGQPHLKAVYDANGKKAEDPTLNPRAFPGFVLFPQMENGWNDTPFRQLEIVIEKLLLTHKIDPNRIYIHGLSDGGGGVWSMIARNPRFFAAALPMSSVKSHSDFTPAFTSKVAEIPIWAFQGGKDKGPTPYDTYQALEKFKMGGGVPKYTIYPNLGHGVWNDAYADAQFFSWMLKQNKSNIHVYFGDSTMCATNGEGVKLGLSRGFLAYQWEKDGVIIPNQDSSKYTATQPGIYRARFSRISASPTEAEWNQWSKPVRVKESNSVTPVISSLTSTHFPSLNGETTVQLNGPTQASLVKRWYKDGVLLPDTAKSILKSASDAGRYTLITQSYDGCPSLESKPVYITSNSPETLSIPTNLRGTVTSPNSVQLFWNDNSQNETGFELYRAFDPNNIWTYLGPISEDAISFHDTGLQPSQTYYYKLRAISATAKSPYTANFQITTTIDVTPPTAPQNLIATTVDVKSVKLSWDAATDNVAIKEYIIYFGTTPVGATGNSSTTFTVTGLTPNSNYAFTVKASDYNNNLSPQSNQLNVATAFSGLNYEYSEGGRENLSLFDWNKAEFTGHVANFTFEPKTQVDYFYFKFYGYLSVTTAGNYQFRLSSDDGSALYLGQANQAYTEGVSGTFNPGNLSQNQIAVRDSLYLCTDIRTNDTSAYQNLSGASFYPFAVLYYEFTGDECLSVQYRGPDTGGAWVNIPDEKLTSGSTPALPSPPGIPTNLSADSPAPTMTTIGLSWSAVSADPVPQYQVYRSTNNTTFNVVATIPGTSYTDNNLLPNTAYFYKVKSTNVNGTSDFSSSVSKTTLPDIVNPSMPAGLTVAGKTYTNVALQWNASTDNVGVTGYNVYTDGTLAGTTQYTTFTVSNLLPNTLYNFTVTALDANGNESDPSVATSVTTDPPAMYYSLPTGNITELSSWNSQQNGSGVAPTSFDFNGQYFKLTRPTCDITSVWTIGGSTSKVFIDDNVNVTIQSGGQVTGKLVVGNNATVNVFSPVTPDFETISPSSTIIFNAYDANNTVPANTSYGNLTLNGSGLKRIEGSLLDIKGSLTLGSGSGITGLAGNGTVVQIEEDFITGSSVAPATSEGRVGVVFTSNATHSITTGTSQAFHKISTGTGATITFDNPAVTTPITLTLGSLNSGGGLDLGAGSVIDIKNNTLVVEGDASINPSNTLGEIAIDHGNIQLKTSTSQNSNLYFSPTANDVEIFTVETTGVGNTTVRGGVNIFDALEINSGSLESAGNIRIKSSATASASIREIKNGGSITGNVIVERYMPAKPGYRYLSTAVDNVTVEDWQSVFSITGNFSGASPGSSTASLYWYSETGGGYKAFPAAGGSNQDLFVKGRGYSINITNNTVNTLSTTGVPYQGDVAFALTPGTGSSANGWNLLGNPYASDIVWSSTGWISSNIASTVYVRQNNSDGTFVWKIWNNTSNIGSLENGKIPAGQAFWVQAGTSPSLTVRENAKTIAPASANTEFYRVSSPEVSSNLLTLELANGTNKDLAFLAFSENGSDRYEKLVDGVKMANSNVNLSTLSEDGVSLAINDLSGEFCNKTVNVSIANVTPGNYTLRFNNVDDFKTAQIQLIDQYLASTVIIDGNNPSYQLTINANAASYKNRLSLKLTRSAITTTNPMSLAKTVLCDDQEVATITIANSQVGVHYEAIALNTNNTLSQNGTGNGNPLQLSIPAAALSDGNNAVRVRASYTQDCAPAIMDNVVTITKSFRPKVTISSPYVHGCTGSDVSITANGSGANYKWVDLNTNVVLPSTGNTLALKNIRNGHSYSVSSINENGCESDAEIVSVEAGTLSTPVVTMDEGILFVATETENIRWMLNGEFIPDANSPAYTPVAAGEYSVWVESNTCIKESLPFDYMVTGIIQGENQFSMRVYPNPSSFGKINLLGSTNSSSVIQCSVIDVMGKTVLSRQIAYDDYNKGIVLASQLAGGLYIVRVNQNNTTLQQKLLVH